MLNFSDNNITVSQFLNFLYGRDAEYLFQVFFGVTDYRLTTKVSNNTHKIVKICKGNNLQTLKNTRFQKKSKAFKIHST